MINFSIYDWVVLGLYLAFLIFIGVKVGVGQKNVKDYFLGSKSLPWWVIGVSIIATETSALTFIGVPAMSFAKGGNLSFVQILIGYVLARIIIAFFMVPQYFKGEVFSPYTLLKERFGNSPLILTSLFFLISGSLAAGVRVYVTAIPLQSLLNIKIFYSILIFIVIAIIYTFNGGIKSVIWTDFLQFFIFVLGGIFALIYIPIKLHSIGVSGIIEEAASAGKFHWFNSSFSFAPPFNIWMGLFGATIGVVYALGVDQLLAQKILSCKNKRDGQKALMLSAAIIFPLFLIFLFVGIALFIYYKHVNIKIPIPLTDGGQPKYDYVFPIFILTETPVVFKGLLISGIFSAALSSISGALSALSSIWTIQFYKRFLKKEASPEFYLKYSRKIIVVFGGILVFVAFLSQNVSLVFNLAFTLTGLTSGAMLGAVVFALLKLDFKSSEIISGMALSFIVMAIIIFLNQIGKISIFWPWYTLIGYIIMAIGTYLHKFFLRKT